MANYLGIDVGGTKCAVSLFDAQQNIIEKTIVPTANQQPAEVTFEKIFHVVRQLINKHDAKPLAIGMSVGGMFDVETGCITHAPHLPLWDDAPLVQWVNEELQLPVFAENDANACALAEWKYGAGQGCEHLLFLTFGTGLGAGIILNGELYRGATGLAGEVGAIRVATDGPAVRNKPGCLEGFASGAGIAQLAMQMQNEQQVTTPLSSTPTTLEIAEAAFAGDAFCKEVFRKSGEMLGRGLAVVIDLLNPQRIIIGSVFVRCESLIRPAMEQAIATEAMPATRNSCQILPAMLGEELGDYAALALAEQVLSK